MENTCWKATLAVAVLALTACSSAPTASSSPAKTDAESKEAGPPQPVTAKTAFWEAYKPAHSWAADLATLSVVYKEIPGVKNEDGKAGLWEITFASPSRREARTFQYAVAKNGLEIRKGVNIGKAIPWGGPTRDVTPFQTGQFAIDSDVAYQTAFKGAEPWLKKHPDAPLTLTLGYATRYPGPVWYVLWGNTKSGYVAYINALTGKTISGK